MDVVGVGLVGGTVADEGGHLDEGGAGVSLGLVDGVADGVEVGVTVLDVLHVPAVGLVAGADILGEGDVGVAVDGDGVVIVEGDELAEAPVGGEGGALTGHTLHVAAVTHDGVGVVVDDLAVGLVEAAREVLLRRGEADGVADAHTEGTGGHLDAVGDEVLGVTGGDGIPLAEVLEVIVLWKEGRRGAGWSAPVPRAIGSENIQNFCSSEATNEGIFIPSAEISAVGAGRVRRGRRILGASDGRSDVECHPTFRRAAVSPDPSPR